MRGPLDKTATACVPALVLAVPGLGVAVEQPRESPNKVS